MRLINLDDAIRTLKSLPNCGADMRGGAGSYTVTSPCQNKIDCG